MSESTLSLTQPQLQRAIGRYLAWDRNPANWSTDQQTDGQDILDAGLRMFYNPPALPQERNSHHWSFLEPIHSFCTIPNQDTYDLPDLFGGFVGDLSCTAGDNAWFPLRQTSITHILTEKQRNITSVTFACQPALYCVQPLKTDGTTPQRFSLILFPPTSNVYTLQGQIYINPNAVSSTLTYPMGGQPHAEAIRQACLAAAELEMNGEQGAHYAEYMIQLRTSVSIDRRATGPKYFGYNRDRSGGGARIDRHALVPTITYNGQDYPGV